MVNKALIRIPWFVLAVMVVAGASLRLAARPRSDRAQQQSKIARGKRAAVKHYVTPRQLVDSNAMVHETVEGLAAVAHDGRWLDWNGLADKRPLVLVFVKEGCPCNVEFEPLIKRLERLYGGTIRFAGVIDAGLEGARRYAGEMRVDHPILCDPELRLIRRFHAENGGYIALLTQEGVIDGLWPGCSADGMKELGKRMARLAGLPERPLDVTDMPGRLTTGCPFGP